MDLAELTVEEMLGYKALGMVYEEYGRAASPCPIYDFYNTGPVENWDTDTVEFFYLSRVREAAPLNFRDQPARVLQPTGMAKRQLTMLRMFNSLRFGMGSLQFLMEPDSRILQRKGMTTIKTQIQDFATKDANTKRLFAAKALSDGIVYVNAEGEILESSSGNAYSIDLGVPSSNQGKIDQSLFGGSGDIIGTAWDDAGALILTDLDQLTRAAEYSNSPPPKHVWMQKTARQWFRANTEIKAFYAAGMERLDRDLQSDTFELNGYTFHFSDSTYLDSTGAVAYHIPATKAIVTPDPNDSRWLARAAGLEYVPTSLDIGGSVEELVNGLAETYGPFTYAVGNHNPVGIDLYMGENWLFGFREPKAVWQLLVDF